MRSYDLALGSHPLFRQQIVYLSQSSCVSPVRLNDGRGVGRGWAFEPNHTTARKLEPLKIVQSSLALVTWWLISVGPGGSSLEMLLASVASTRASHQSRKSIKRVQA